LEDPISFEKGKEEVNKVFIVNRGGHDHTDAKRFGRLVFLSEGEVNRYATNVMYRTFAEKLRDSSPTDYILITGLSVMSSLACSIFGRLHGRINLLLYHGSGPGVDGHYVERTVMLDELLTKENDK